MNPRCTLKVLFLAGILLTELRAQPLPVVPMHLDPDQIVHSLRDRRPLMPPADCDALGLWECTPYDPVKMTDISVRWLQLDDDPELEAIITTEAAKENETYVAYVFDHRGTWNLVGSFYCGKWTCDTNYFIQARKLTENPPKLLLVTRDLSGSAIGILATDAFQLRKGQLWHVLSVTDKEIDSFPSPQVYRQRVFASSTRLVIHTVKEEPPGRVAGNTCEVWGWDRDIFISMPADFSKYCNPKTGKPIADKSSWAGLPIFP